MKVSSFVVYCRFFSFPLGSATKKVENRKRLLHTATQSVTSFVLEMIYSASSARPRMKGFVQFAASFCLGWVLVGNLKVFQLPRFTKFSTIQSRRQLDIPKVIRECLPCGKGNISTKSNSQLRAWKLKNKGPKDGSYRFYHNGRIYGINNEPSIGMNGLRRMEFDQITERAQAVALRVEGQHFKGSIKVEDLFVLSPHFHHPKYLINLHDEDKKRVRVELDRPFTTDSPHLIDIRIVEEDTTLLVAVTTVFKAAKRLEKFLQRYKENVLKDLNLKHTVLKIVLYHNDESLNETLEILDKFKKSSHAAIIELVMESGKFNRAAALNAGATKCSDDAIILFVDVDMYITSRFLERVKRNVVRNETVWFPIAYSQYDPNIIDMGADIVPSLKEKAKDKMVIHKQTGFWIHYAFGISAMYKSDYDKIGFVSHRKGWGGEDVDFYQKALADPYLTVMNSVDPDLIHIFHSRGCDVKLSPDQLRMCMGAWSDTLGSQLQLAALLLNRTLNK